MICENRVHANCADCRSPLNESCRSVAALAVPTPQISGLGALSPKPGIETGKHKPHLSWPMGRHLLLLGIALAGEVVILVAALFASGIVEF
jgi:hypothetical protein